MDNVIVKFLIVEVDGEAVLSFPVVSLPDGIRIEMLEAVLASNPVLRLVENAELGKVWNGTEYA